MSIIIKIYNSTNNRLIYQNVSERREHICLSDNSIIVNLWEIQISLILYYKIVETNNNLFKVDIIKETATNEEIIKSFNIDLSLIHPNTPNYTTIKHKLFLKNICNIFMNSYHQFIPNNPELQKLYDLLDYSIPNILNNKRKIDNLPLSFLNNFPFIKEYLYHLISITQSEQLSHSQSPIPSPITSPIPSHSQIKKIKQLPNHIQSMIFDNLSSKNENSCPICLDMIAKEDFMVTFCGHHYHNNCINNCIKTSVKCPECRQVIIDKLS
jgi:hypothetical protein